jgi:peptide/nickel transport system ATP-binding protein
MTASDSSGPLLIVKNLKTHLLTDRGLVRAVDGISFTLDRGMTLGLVGESGSGKSMLCRTILGLLPRAAIMSRDASIIFDGREITQLPEKGLNRLRGLEIAMIMQDPMLSLNPTMTVGTQITESLTYHLGMKRKPARGRAIELLKSVGIPMPERRVDQYPHQLSGGLRQRVAIAIALACEPKLLLADEPTTALDVTVQTEVLDLLQHLQKERDMAMILITHDLGVVAGRAHEIAVMYAGKIVEQAQTSELFSDMRMPYTRALMDSIPRLDDPPHTRLSSIAGQPPDPIGLPIGCRFAPRCPVAGKRCLEEDPPFEAHDRGGHLFACWYPAEFSGVAM